MSSHIVSLSGHAWKQSGGYSRGVPPLPIPNREVKPARADGTAPQCGRVGRRLFSLQQKASHDGMPSVVGKKGGDLLSRIAVQYHRRARA